MMLRYRRYRVFLVFAIFLVFILYRFTTRQEWEAATASSVEKLKGYAGQSYKGKIEEPELVLNQPQAPPKAKITPHPTHLADKIEAAIPQATAKPIGDWELGAQVTTTTKPKAKPTPAKIPETTTTESPGKEFGLEGQGRLDDPVPLDDGPVIRWEQMPQHFPVPKERIITLPTGSPKKLPQLQHVFKEETASEKADREKKQSQIKKAFEHSWKGYKKFAWLHDELKPMSGKNRDTFCGWGATLVDALDTLWIMGFKAEFGDAVAALEKIDFTTTPRADIPVFETTIRYLGGLLAAYDISGAKYDIILTKAKQLGDILLSAFDTPNRMPITYYNWRPAFAKNAHRAGTRTVLAELGSLTMEFTRLAQLTGEDKYYDAVARITNELELMQSKTRVPGLWPERIDTSGCQKPPPPVLQETVEQQTLAGQARAKQSKADAEIDIVEIITNGDVKYAKNSAKAAKPVKTDADSGELEKRQVIADMDELPGVPKVIDAGAAAVKSESAGAVKASKKTDKAAKEKGPTSDELTAIPKGFAAGAPAVKSESDGDAEAPKKSSKATKEKISDSDESSAVPKGFVAGAPAVKSESDGDAKALKKSDAATTEKKASDGKTVPGSGPGLRDAIMATSQRPTGEKPKSMDKASTGPLIADKAEIIPPGQKQGKVNPNPPETLTTKERVDCLPQGLASPPRAYSESFKLGGSADSTYEYLPKMHLLLGGLTPQYGKMYSAAIDAANRYLLFRQMIPEEDREVYVVGRAEVREAWADEPETEGNFTLSPEQSHLLCFTGGMYGMGAKLFDRKEDFEIAKKITDGCVWAYESTASGIMPESMHVLPCQDRASCPWNETLWTETLDPYWRQREEQRLQAQADIEAFNAEIVDDGSEVDDATAGAYRVKQSQTGLETAREPKLVEVDNGSLAKRQLVEDVLETADKLAVKVDVANNHKIGEEVGTPVKKAATKTKAAVKETKTYDPYPSHKDYVATRITQGRLPKGVPTISSRQYILRPEAIESVFIMYRMTGDEYWREKGWKMWQAIERETKAEYGHSAIRDVTRKDYEYNKNDEMESFWLAETLKYFYLLFSTPDTVSLDDWVLNTEAHPFKRPK